jgi:hypothetical protein
MNHISRALFIIVLLFQFSFVVRASLPYPFEGLLPRAETVFIGRIKNHTEQDVTFEITEKLRGGTAPKTLSFHYSGYDDRRLSDVSVPCLVMSQGDDHFGKPEPIVSLGQKVKGQAGYRGWIAFPIRTDGDVIYLDLISTLAGQKPGDKPARLTLGKARTLIHEVPYKPNLNGSGV